MESQKRRSLRDHLTSVYWLVVGVLGFGRPNRRSPRNVRRRSQERSDAAESSSGRTFVPARYDRRSRSSTDEIEGRVSLPS
jgi:hypothetical protein